jgi:hypothetical protein
MILSNSNPIDFIIYDKQKNMDKPLDLICLNKNEISENTKKYTSNQVKSLDFAKKVYYSQLKNIELFFDEDTLYKINHSGITFDLFCNLKKESSILYVLGQGAIDEQKRHKYGLPLFQRWSWFEDFPYSVMIFSDPTLYIGNLEIGWFQGTKETYYLPLTCEIIQHFINRLGLTTKNIIFSGSSAGGFTSLMMAGYFPNSSVFVNNPQTDIRKYHQSLFEKLISICFSGISLEEALDIKFESRFSVVKHYHDTKNIPNIYYAQNINDKFHMQNHFMPFANEIAKMAAENRSFGDIHFFTELYCDEKLNHNPFPKKDFLQRLNRTKHFFSKTLIGK